MITGWTHSSSGYFIAEVNVWRGKGGKLNMGSLNTIIGLQDGQD